MEDLNMGNLQAQLRKNSELNATISARSDIPIVGADLATREPMLSATPTSRNIPRTEKQSMEGLDLRNTEGFKNE